MITKKQLKVFEVLKKNFHGEWTFSEIKEELKETSNSKLQKAIKDFEEEELIIIKKKKGYNSIKLNLNSSNLINYFTLIDYGNLDLNILKLLREIKQEILEETTFFSIVVFGSYSNKKIKKDSDLDIALIFDNKRIFEKIIPKMNSVKRKSFIEIDEHYFSEKEFIELLNSKKQNLGKEIKDNFLVFYGGDFFYNLIFENGKFS